MVEVGAKGGVDTAQSDASHGAPACKLYWTQKGTMRPQKLVEAALSPRPNSLTGQKRKTGDAAATPSPLSGLAALDAKRIKAMSPAGGRLSSQHVNVFAGMESTAELDTRQSLLLGGGHALLATNVARSSASGDVNADADLDAPDDAGTISPQLLHSPSLLHIGDLQDDRADSPATAARKRASRNDADWLPKSERACVNCHVTETALWRKFEGMYMCNGKSYHANALYSLLLFMPSLVTRKFHSLWIVLQSEWPRSAN